MGWETKWTGLSSHHADCATCNLQYCMLNNNLESGFLHWSRAELAWRESRFGPWCWSQFDCLENTRSANSKQLSCIQNWQKRHIGSLRESHSSWLWHVAGNDWLLQIRNMSCMQQAAHKRSQGDLMGVQSGMSQKGNDFVKDHWRINEDDWYHTEDNCAVDTTAGHDQEERVAWSHCGIERFLPGFSNKCIMFVNITCHSLGYWKCVGGISCTKLHWLGTLISPPWQLLHPREFQVHDVVPEVIRHDWDGF
jgi:hypothetical protein